MLSIYFKTMKNQMIGDHSLMFTISEIIFIFTKANDLFDIWQIFFFCSSSLIFVYNAFTALGPYIASTAAWEFNS